MQSTKLLFKSIAIFLLLILTLVVVEFKLEGQKVVREAVRSVDLDSSQQCNLASTSSDFLGALLDKSVSVGSNQINSVQFSIDKQKPLRDEARKLAVEDAVRKAKLYADAAGVSLGDIIQISEAGGVRPPRPMMMRRSEIAADSAPVPIARGEQTISVNVNITL